MTEALYLVWNPDASIPRYRHYSRDSAITEAKRLARQNPGKKFYVMEPIGAALLEDPVKWVETSDLPF